MREKSCSAALRTAFIDTNLETHLAVNLSDADTVADLKKKVAMEHSHCFPNIGDIAIHALKLRRRSQFYHLSDSMLVKSAFEGFSGTWFLHLDATASATFLTKELGAPVENHLKSEKPQLLSIDLQPSNLFHSVDRFMEDNLHQPDPDTKLSDHPEKVTSDLSTKLPAPDESLEVPSDNRFDLANKDGETPKALEHTSKVSVVQSGKSVSDVRVADSVTKRNELLETEIPLKTDLKANEFRVIGTEVRSATFVTVKKDKSKRSRDVELDNSVILDEPVAKKKRNEKMENKVTFPEPMKNPIKDARDRERFEFENRAPDFLTEHESTRKLIALKEMDSRPLSDDQSSPKLLVGKKKRKNKKSSNLKNKVYSEVLSKSNDRNLDVDGSNFEIGLSGCYPVGSSGKEVAQKNSEKALEVSPRGLARESKFEIGMSEAPPSDPYLLMKGMHQSPSNPEATLANTCASLSGHHNNVNSSIDTTGEIGLGSFLSQDKDAAIGSRVEIKENFLDKEISSAGKKGKKPKNNQFASEKTLATPLIENTDKDNIMSKYGKVFDGEGNVAVHESNETGLENTTSMCKQSSLDEAQINSHDGHVNLKSSQVPEVAEAGDLRHKSRKRSEARKIRSSGLQAYSSSVIEEVNQEMEGEIIREGTNTYAFGSSGSEVAQTNLRKELEVSSGLETALGEVSSNLKSLLRMGTDHGSDKPEAISAETLTSLSGLHHDNVNSLTVTAALDSSLGRIKDAAIGDKVENKEFASLKEATFADKNLKKPKKRHSATNKNLPPPLIVELNKVNITLEDKKGTLGDENIGADEPNGDRKEDDMPNCIPLGPGEAQIITEGGHDTPKIPEAPKIAEAGDLREGRRKKMRNTGVNKHASLGEEAISQKSDGKEILVSKNQRVRDSEMDNGFIQSEDSKTLKTEGLNGNKTDNVTGSELNSWKFVQSSRNEESLESRSDKGKSRSNIIPASAEKDSYELLRKKLDSCQTSEKKCNLSAEYANKCKSEQVHLDRHPSEIVVEKEKNLDPCQTAETEKEEPRKRKKSRSEKANPKTDLSGSIMEGENDRRVHADMTLLASVKTHSTDVSDNTHLETQNSTNIDFLEIFVPKLGQHESVDPREDHAAKKACMETPQKEKNNEWKKKIIGRSTDAFPGLKSHLGSNNPSSKGTSIISGENYEAAPQNVNEIVKGNGFFLKQSNVNSVVSSDNPEGVVGTIYTSRQGRQAQPLSDCYRVAVRKPSSNKLGEVLNSSTEKKILLADMDSIFRQSSSENDQDGGEISYSDSSAQNLSDDSSTSDYKDEGIPISKKQGNIDSPPTGLMPSVAYNGKKGEISGDDIIHSPISTARRKPLGTILRSSRSYRKAKIMASQFMIEDSESQAVDFVPNSQANQP